MTQRIPRRYRRVAERFVSGNHVQLLRNGDQSFGAMLKAIAEAQQQVLLETYWFGSDGVGRRFAEALSGAKARGVEVAVLYDSVGSWEADEQMFEQMSGEGVHVLEFNPLGPWKKRFRLARLTLRDHAKILVADNAIGFTGGVNLAEAWLSPSEGGSGWRDDMVRVEGPSVMGLTERFLSTWTRQGGVPLRQPETRHDAPAGAQNVRVLSAGPYGRHRRQIIHAYLHNIYRAKQRVWISNSYFVPEPSVVRALCRAGRRGVDVRILVPAYSDVEIARHASRAVWGKLLRSGVHIYEWLESIFHSKTAVIDGEWSTIGSFNLDYLSLSNNLEVNVAVLDRGFGAVMEASFLRDLESSQEIELDHFRFRPLSDRLVEWILYRLRKFL